MMEAYKSISQQAVEGKSKQELLQLVGNGEEGSPHEQKVRAALLIKCTEDLEAALGSLSTAVQSASSASTSVAKKLYILNFLLVFATAVMAVEATIRIYDRW